MSRPVAWLIQARDFEQGALVDELEQAVRADAGFFGEPPAVDVERRPVQQLVRVTDADRAQAAHVVFGDSSQVLERSVHRLKNKGRV